jgi:hypothetical protein
MVVVKLLGKLLAQRFVPFIVMPADDSLLENHVLNVLRQLRPAFENRFPQCLAKRSRFALSGFVATV